VAKVELKQPIIDEISALVKDAQSVVLVDYRGLTVEEDTRLRRQLREAGISYKVYKNTLMTRAFQGTDLEALNSLLKGPNAIAVCNEDATTAAGILTKFAKEVPALEVKAGVVEGTFYDATGMKAVADVPPRDVLLGRLLGSMQSPIVNFARVLKQIAEKEDVPVADAAVKEDVPVADAAEKVEVADAAEKVEAPVADVAEKVEVPVADAVEKSEASVADVVEKAEVPVADAAEKKEEE